MENGPAGSKRSPWFYVLLGCGGLAAAICLVSAATVFFVGRQAKNIGEGLSGMDDPKERQKKALEQLGGLPEGYSVLASVSVFGMMKTTTLADHPASADGGLPAGSRTFNYSRVIANEQNAKSRAFFEGTDGEDAAQGQGPFMVSPQAVVKRGQLNLDPRRRVLYVVFRGQGATAGPSLASAVMFACPDDALRVGVWAQSDPNPDAPAEKLELEGTVADEAQLARFLKPMDPCGR